MDDLIISGWETPVLTHIGDINNGIDGKERYIHVKRLDDDFDEESLGQLRKAMTNRYYRDTDVPGGYFCHSVDVHQIDHNVALVIVYGQYNV